MYIDPTPLANWTLLGILSIENVYGTSDKIH